MKLLTYCKKCKGKNAVKSKGIYSRADLENLYGNAVPITCSICDTQYSVRPNQVFAVGSKIPILICSLICILLFSWGITVVDDSAWGFIGILLTCGLIMTAAMYSTKSSSARAFNKYYI